MGTVNQTVDDCGVVKNCADYRQFIGENHAAAYNGGSGGDMASTCVAKPQVHVEGQ